MPSGNNHWKCNLRKIIMKGNKSIDLENQTYYQFLFDTVTTWNFITKSIFNSMYNKYFKKLNSDSSIEYIQDMLNGTICERKKINNNKKNSIYNYILIKH